MTRQLQLIDAIVSEGRDEFTFEEAKARLAVSTEATANFLARLSKNGLVDRLARGHYVIRPFGTLGTSAATEDLSIAVGAAFEGRKHRIAYLSALAELGVLTHPVRTIYVACTERVRFSTVSRRSLRLIEEKLETIHLEAEVVNRSWCSTLERALFECALRVDLVGGAERLASALATGSRNADAARIARLAQVFGPRGRAAERRLASISTALQLPLNLAPEVNSWQQIIRLDPRDDHVAWTDTKFRVDWNTTIDELQAVVWN